MNFFSTANIINTGMSVLGLSLKTIPNARTPFTIIPCLGIRASEMAESSLRQNYTTLNCRVAIDSIFFYFAKLLL